MPDALPLEGIDTPVCGFNVEQVLDQGLFARWCTLGLLAATFDQEAAKSSGLGVLRNLLRSDRVLLSRDDQLEVLVELCHVCKRRVQSVHSDVERAAALTHRSDGGGVRACEQLGEQ